MYRCPFRGLYKSQWGTKVFSLEKILIIEVEKSNISERLLIEQVNMFLQANESTIVSLCVSFDYSIFFKLLIQIWFNFRFTQFCEFHRRKKYNKWFWWEFPSNSESYWDVSIIHIYCKYLNNRLFFHYLYP